VNPDVRHIGHQRAWFNSWGPKPAWVP
jgi:hypothetical protein